jgi:hypothetical protein
MTFRYAALVILAASTIAGCRRTDVRDFEIKVPELTRANAAMYVNALMAYDGIKDVAKLDKNSIVIDETTRTIKVKYDSMKVAKKNLEMAIALAGFEANGVTPESVGAKRAAASVATPAEAKPAEAKPEEAK